MLFAVLSSLALAAACSDGEAEPQWYTTCPPINPMYASVKGRVTDAEGVPVRGIQVSILADWTGRAVVYTDENGEFAFVRARTSTVPYVMAFRDIDGVDNGAFEDLCENVGFVQCPDEPSVKRVYCDFTAPDVEVRMEKLDVMIIEN